MWIRTESGQVQLCSSHQSNHSEAFCFSSFLLLIAPDILCPRFPSTLCLSAHFHGASFVTYPHRSLSLFILCQVSCRPLPLSSCFIEFQSPKLCTDFVFAFSGGSSLSHRERFLLDSWWSEMICMSDLFGQDPHHPLANQLALLGSADPGRPCL